MVGFLTGSQFGWKVAWRVGIFLALTLGFPFIIYGIVLATGAQRVGGASGAMAVVVGIFLKPVIILAFLIAMISPSWKRMRSLGIFPLWGLMIPLLLAMDYTYFFAVGNFWGASFSMGILAVQMPIYAMTALVLWQSRSRHRATSRVDCRALAVRGRRLSTLPSRFWWSDWLRRPTAHGHMG